MSDGPNGRIRVIVAEPSGIIRDSVRSLLQSEPDVDVIADHGSIEDCMASLEQLRPDVLVTELTLAQGGSGLALITRAVARLPRIGCIVLAQGADSDGVRAAMTAGAGGFVSTQATKSELLTALKIVHAGERYLCRVSASLMLTDLLAGSAKALAAGPGRGPVDGITPREREVLIRVALGNSNKVIAHEMGVSMKTVEKHRANFMRKLCLRGTAGATAFAVSHGLAGHGMPARSSR